MSHKEDIPIVVSRLQDAFDRYNKSTSDPAVFQSLVDEMNRTIESGTGVLNLRTLDELHDLRKLVNDRVKVLTTFENMKQEWEKGRY